MAPPTLGIQQLAELPKRVLAQMGRLRPERPELALATRLVSECDHRAPHADLAGVPQGD
jgi:hypothetical protein